MTELPDHLKRECPVCGELYSPLEEHDCPEGPERSCPHCGETFRGLVDAHDCDELPPTAADACPICGAPMESWLDHMVECPGPDRDDDDTHSAAVGPGRTGDW